MESVVGSRKMNKIMINDNKERVQGGSKETGVVVGNNGAGPGDGSGGSGGTNDCLELDELIEYPPVEDGTQ